MSRFRDVVHQVPDGTFVIETHIVVTKHLANPAAARLSRMAERANDDELAVASLRIRMHEEEAALGCLG